MSSTLSWQLIDRRIADSAPWWCSQVAGRWVHANFRFDPVATPLAEPPGAPGQNLPASDVPTPSWTITHTIEAQLGGRVHSVQVGEGPDGHRYCRFDHGLLLRVGSRRAEVDAPTSESGQDVIEALLGPGLLLLAAEQGAFAIHAAAVADDRGIVLLVGPSGQGKSSLARVASGSVPGSNPTGSIQRVADDIVLLDHDFGFCAPFPQLKLDPMLLPVPATRSVRMLVWPEFDDSSVAPELHPLTAAATRLRLIRDSVAARLFSPAQLAAHLQWVTRLSMHMPAFVLRRPRVDPALVGVANRHTLDQVMRPA